MKKYKVTQEFMDELKTWINMLEANVVSINEFFFDETIKNVENWRSEYVSQADRNQRFGAIVNWINGEDVFEVGAPKYVVQLKGVVPLLGKGYVYTATDGYVSVTYSMEDATKFDDFEKASEWTNKNFEVVEAKEYENTIFEAVELDE